MCTYIKSCCTPFKKLCCATKMYMILVNHLNKAGKFLKKINSVTNLDVALEFIASNFCITLEVEKVSKNMNQNPEIEIQDWSVSLHLTQTTWSMHGKKTKDIEKIKEKCVKSIFNSYQTQRIEITNIKKASKLRKKVNN